MTETLPFQSELSPQLAWFSLTTLIDEVMESIRPKLLKHGIEVCLDCLEIPRISADRKMIRQALFHLTQNAIEVMQNGGSLEIVLWDSGTTVEIEVADSGPGIGDMARHPINSPSFSSPSKTNSENIGTKIRKAQQIISLHGGEIQAMNCPQGGAAFIIAIPRNTQQAAA